MRIPADHQRCLFTTRDGKRCRGYRGDHELPMCFFHIRQHRLKTDPAVAAAEGESVVGRPPRLKSARAINLVLNRVFLAAAQGRVTPSQAAGLASLARLLLQSLRNVQEEQRLIQQRHQERASGEVRPAEAAFLSEAECCIVNRIRETVRDFGPGHDNTDATFSAFLSLGVDRAPRPAPAPSPPREPAADAIRGDGHSAPESRE